MVSQGNSMTPHRSKNLTKADLLLELQAAREQIAALKNAHSSADSSCIKTSYGGKTINSDEARFRLLFESMPMGVTFQDAKGTIVEANAAAQKILGLPLAQLCGRTSLDPCWKAIHEDGSEFPGETHPTMVALQTGQPISDLVMGVFNPATEAYRWIRINAIPQFDPEDKSLIGVQATFEDFTERKRAESALRISEENYRSLAENSESAVTVIDRKGRLLYANPWTIKIWQDPNVVGKTVFDLFPVEYAQRYSAAIQQVIDTGISIFDDVETSINGKVMWFRLSMSPIRSVDGTIDTLLLNAWDATRHKIAEQALRESSRIIQESQAIAKLGSWTADLQTGTFDVTAEAAHIIGCKPGALKIEELMEIVHPEDRQRMRNAWDAAMCDGSYEIEHRLLRYGEVRWVHVKAVFNPAPDGKRVSALGITQDITERKHAAMALTVSEKKLRSLVQSQSHFMIRTDMHGRYTYWNKKYKEEFGWIYGGDDLTGVSVLRGICDHHHERACKAAEKCLAEPGKVFRVELDKPGLDGSVRTTLWELLCLTDENESPSEIQGMGIEITDRKRAEEALRASEEKYRGLVESLDSILYTVNFDGQMLYMNDLAAKLLGGTPSDYLNKSVHELFPEHIASKRLETLHRAMREDKSITVEAEGIVQGSRRWYRTTIQPIHDNSGQVVYALVNSTDIHDLKMAQDELLSWSHSLEERIKERTSEIQDLYDNAPTGYHSVDENGNFIMMNKTELRWLGYTHEEIVGQPAINFLEPSSRDDYLKAFANLKQLGWLQDIELEFVRKDGRRLPVSLSSIAVYDRDGKYVFSRTNIFDITERKQAEQELRDSEERYRKAIGAADAVPYTLDYASNTYTFMGEGIEKITGYRREELTPVKFESLIQQTSMQGDLDSLSTEEATRQVRAGERNAVQAVWRSDFLIKHKNGEDYWLSDISIQVLDVNGKPTGSIGILLNITDRKKTEEVLRLANIEMERALRTKDEFLTSMSHELRTPLTGILGLSEALQYETYGTLNDDQRTALVNIENSGRHLLDLINDILDISKMEAGKLDLQMEPIPLSEICEAALQLTRGMAHKKNQILAYSMESASTIVLGDARRLKQILVNLLSNAIKYSHEGNKVGLEVNPDRESGTVKLTVWDNGIGISAEDLKKLFKPFLQLDSSLTRQQNGTGLGLALVQRLVDLHGGSIEVQSNPGRGSRFTVILPMLPEDIIQGRHRNLSPLARPQRALIIEDNHLDAERLCQSLKVLGIESETYMKGEGAVHRAMETCPQIIFLDLVLPDASGWDVIDQLKQNYETSGIPVIVTSVVDDQEQAFQRGAAGYLLKFFTQSDLYLAIERIQNAIDHPYRVRPGITALSSLSSARVMIVDDNEVNIFMLRDFLQSKNLNVAIVHSGFECLSRIAELQPDLVLMDIQMPGMDGLETIRRLRSNPDPRIAALPVIAITALAMPGDRERCLQAGANVYISKPMHLEQLLATIQKMLEKESLQNV
jgi:PAS domain S-box-containing protein